MENNVEKALNEFIDASDEQKEETKKINNQKKVVLGERDGLIIERIDKQFITSDGRLLLREVY